MKKLHNPPDKKTLRQKLRHNATPAGEGSLAKPEKVFCRSEIRRQHGVGPYVLDFYCPEHKLALEIQGSVHDDVLRSNYDAERQALRDFFLLAQPAQEGQVA